MRRFGGKNLLADDRQTGCWTSLVQTKALAEWSCRTAAHVVTDLCSGVPPSNLQMLLDFVRRIFESHVATLG